MWRMARRDSGDAGGSGAAAPSMAAPTAAFSRVMPGGVRMISDSEIRSPRPVLNSAAPAARAVTSPGSSPAHATMLMAPREWPTSSAGRPSGSAASSTAWRSPASAWTEKSPSGGLSLRPCPRRS
jgi:hypothetical protein